jgi:hypothetical protein
MKGTSPAITQSWLEDLRQSRGVKINNSPEVVYSDKSQGKVQAGKTDNEGYKEIDENGKVVGTIEKSTITLNFESIDKTETVGNTDVKGMSFNEKLGAVLGHEVEHTTDENYTLSVTGKDAEAPAYKVSDKIIAETKSNKQ